MRLFLVALLLSGSVYARGTSYASKLLLRMDNGLLWNKGEAGGSTSSLGGINFNYLLYLTSQFGLGVGYQVNFDISRSKVPLHGFDFFARYYLWGLGTRVKERALDMTTETRDGWSGYLVVGTRQNALVVREPLASSDTTVTSWSINQGIGADYRLSHNFDLTAELNLSLFSFADENPRYRLGSCLFKLGVNFLW